MLASLIITFAEKTRLQSLGLTQEEFQEEYRFFVIQKWKQYVLELSTEIAHIEYFWWFQLFWDTGMQNGEINRLMLSELFGRSLNDPEIFDLVDSLVAGLKKVDVFPLDLTPLEYWTMLFVPLKIHLHRGDPIYQTMGVKSGKEFKEMFGSPRLVIAKMIVDNNLKGLAKAFIHDLRRECSKSETHHPRLSKESMARLVDSGSIHKGYEFKDKEGRKFTEIIDSNCVDIVSTDQERLEEFSRMADIDMDDLSPKEQAHLLELLHVLDMGYQVSSKRGRSLKDFYGDKSDAKKVTRSRLFKKIRNLNEKAKQRTVVM